MRSRHSVSASCAASVCSSSARSAARCSTRLRVGPEARIGREIRPVEALAQLAELAVVRRRPERSRRRPRGTCRTDRCWDARCRAGAARGRTQNQFAACGTSRLSPASNSVALDALAGARAIARVQRHQDAGHRDVAGEMIDDGHAEAHRSGRLGRRSRS